MIQSEVLKEVATGVPAEGAPLLSSIAFERVLAIAERLPRAKELKILAEQADVRWAPAIGLAERAVERGLDELAYLQLRTALEPSGACEINLGSECGSLFVSGRLFSVAGNAAVEWAPEQIRVSGDRADGRAMPDLGDTWTVQTVSPGRPAYVIHSQLKEQRVGFPWIQSGAARDGITDQPLQPLPLSEALNIVESTDAALLPWIANALEGVLLVCGSGRRRVATDPSFPGLIALPRPETASELAEILVGEAARQHMIGLLMLAELTEPHANYYDTRTRTYRSVHSALFAAHGYVNRIRFARRLKSLDDTARERLLVAELMFEEECVSVLDDAPLTAIGRELWDILRQSPLK